MSNDKIWLTSPHMGGDEMEYIEKAFNTNWIAPLGPNVNKFEKEIADYLGVAYGAALKSGTAAIHLALVILGVRSEDEVICQSFTFSASANPIIYQNARPVFVDSEEDTWNMDPDLLEEAIKDRINTIGKPPKAVIAVHIYGQTAKIVKISEVCKKYNIPLIEDAAEALGSSYNGKKLGTFGDIGILSFNGNKIITTSGGGMLVSENKDHVKRARFLATQARDDAPHYEHSHIGYNYRMSNVLAGIGLGQLDILEERIKKKRKIFEFYKSSLNDILCINFQPEMKNSLGNRWLSVVEIDSDDSNITREKVRLALLDNNIDSRPLWKPMHSQPIFVDCVKYTNGVSEKLFKNGLCLPSDTNMDKDGQKRVIDIIRSKC